MSTVTLESAYQKMGTKIPAGMSAADALDHVGLSGWNQRLIQPFVMDGGTEYPAGKNRYNVADLPIGPRILGPVLATYRPIQNEEAFLPLMDGFADAGMIPIVAGAYDDGAASFIQFEIPKGLCTWANGEVARTVLLHKRNDGEGAIKGFPDFERIFCANQIRSLAKGVAPAITVRHTRGANPYVAQTAERLLGITQDWDESIAATFRTLSRTSMSKKDFADSFVPDLLGERPEEKGASQTIYDRKFDELVASWSSPVAVEGDTAWRAYNAVTEFEQHRRTTNEVRLARAVLNGRQPLTDRAVKLLLG